MKSNSIAIVSLKRLSYIKRKKYDLEDDTKIVLLGYKRFGRDIHPDANSEVEMWYYTTHGSPKLLALLKGKKRVQTDTGYAYFLKGSSDVIILIPLMLMLLLIIAIGFCIYSLKYENAQKPIVPEKTVEGAEKAEVEQTTADDGFL